MMKKEVFSFLQSYSFNPTDIDRLIVSSFLIANKIENPNNILLNRLFIKKGDPDYKYLLEFIGIDKLEGFEQLIETFEFVISPEDKIITGAIYTPENIRQYIVEQAYTRFENFRNILICDPACGCSGFLYNSAKILKEKTNRTYREIFEHNIYGLDIQEYSISRSKILLTLLAVIEGEDDSEFCFNLFQGNALSFQWEDHLINFSGFDVVVGNPPYVCSRNIEPETKQLLENWKVCSTGHPDLYIPFFEIGLTILKENGVLGFITMNTFFKSVNGRALREYFQNEKFDFKILDFGSQQIFQSKSTYTCVCIIQKTESEVLKYFRLSTLDLLLENDFPYNSISYSNLNAFSGWNLQEVDVINKIESTGTPFGTRFKSRNGIATLKNNIFIFDPSKEDNDFYYLNNGSEYQIEKQICKDIINPNKLTKLDSIEHIKKKIIFPYIFKDEKVELISETEFKNSYPKAFSYLYANKKLLSKRDKGNGTYENWYAYGRNQSLEKLKYKLFFPHITPSTPNFVLNSDENILFHNGLAIIGENEKELQFLQKLMSSRLFWFYIINTSKPYGSGYYSLSRNYIKNFGIFDFTENEIDYIISENNSEILNEFIESKYGVTFNSPH
jgi:hypothetical protein